MITDCHRAQIDFVSEISDRPIADKDGIITLSDRRSCKILVSNISSYVISVRLDLGIFRMTTLALTPGRGTFSRTEFGYLPTFESIFGINGTITTFSEEGNGKVVTRIAVRELQPTKYYVQVGNMYFCSGNDTGGKVVLASKDMAIPVYKHHEAIRIAQSLGGIVKTTLDSV